MFLLQVILLAIIQGLAELLPISSSAHVVVAEKLMGLDPSSPAMTLLLVMLHTGTMFAVIVYFWKQWRATFFSSKSQFGSFAWLAILATVLTAIVGEILIKIIEHTVFKGVPHAQIEDLFSHLGIIAPALLAAGILILIAGLMQRPDPDDSIGPEITMVQAGLIGAVQGLCLPFRGFSRSGAGAQGTRRSFQFCAGRDSYAAGCGPRGSAAAARRAREFCLRRPAQRAGSAVFLSRGSACAEVA
jgi:undecaprenyl-diphosphatase